MKLVAFAVVVQAVLQDEVSGCGREWGLSGFAEGDEERAVGFLVVREVAAVFVQSVEGDFGEHGGLRV